jgi:EAL domain-containing protein (putative c-di-GMP-specific phosphodiesterase class I)
LKSLGIRRAIHNFGTGYSSLTHMRELPTDVIKIDRSFVQGVDKVWEDTATCATVTRLAHGLRMTVVAEGIERGTQLAAVAEQGCDQGQGFLFAPPMMPDVLEKFMRDRNGSWSGEQESHPAGDK